MEGMGITNFRDNVVIEWGNGPNYGVGAGSTSSPDEVDVRDVVGEPEDTRPPGYIYGFEALYSCASGPLSPEDILAWLQIQSSGINADLRTCILHAEQRNKVVEDLDALLAQMTESGDYLSLEAQADEILAAYEGTPFEETVQKALACFDNSIDKAFGENELQTARDQMQTQIDALGKDAQMDMINIQQLTNRLNEQFGFASAYAAKHHDTSMAIISNI